ncbi:MAG: DinB family protein [Bacteroidetes bacterium]|nr:DinB family protein [Bacteroidota bacterium]
MNNQIDKIRTTRKFLLKLIDGLTAAQLNTIPKGFNNNIIWNIGHLVVSVQGICYVRAGLQPTLDNQYIQKYRTETKPESAASEEEIDFLKTQLLSSLDQLEADLEKNIFSNYTPWATRYGVEMKNIDDALAFIPYHEGMHTGYIMAMKRVI